MNEKLVENIKNILSKYLSDVDDVAAMSIKFLDVNDVEDVLALKVHWDNYFKMIKVTNEYVQRDFMKFISSFKGE